MREPPIFVGELWRARDALFDLSSDSAREHSRRVGRQFTEAHDVFLIGRGVHRVTALEAALKLKEVAGLRAEAFPGGEMKHGPLALVDEGTPVVIFYGDEDMVSAEASASELVSRGAQIYTVGSKPLRVSSEHLRVGDTGFATPIPQMLPMQILAYEIAPDEEPGPRTTRGTSPRRSRYFETRDTHAQHTGRFGGPGTLDGPPRSRR